MEEDGCAMAEPNTSCGLRWGVGLGMGHSGLITHPRLNLDWEQEEWNLQGRASGKMQFWGSCPVLPRPQAAPTTPGTAISWEWPPMVSALRHIKGAVPRVLFCTGGVPACLYCGNAKTCPRTARLCTATCVGAEPPQLHAAQPGHMQPHAVSQTMHRPDPTLCDIENHERPA